MIFQDLNNITDIYNKSGLAIQRMYNQSGDIIWEKSIFDIYDVTTDPYYTQYFTITPTNGSYLKIKFTGNTDNLYIKAFNTEIPSEWYHSTSSDWEIETSAPVLFKQNTDYPVRFKITRVSGSGTYDVSGNIMSLLYGDDFIGKTELKPSSSGYIFSDFFRYNDSNNNAKLINAENLILPATKLTDYCYQCMFWNCYYLKTTPKILPATTLTIDCYYSMFNSCIQIEKTPLLPATTLRVGCYVYMFRDCTNLTTAPELPSTTLANFCYEGMFLRCTSLKKAPELTATTLKDYCYRDMFSGCTSLTTAPELPATTLTEGCYYCMFEGCTSLTTAPELPATTLVKWCYYFMFSGCTSLTTAPELPATTLAYQCYRCMFGSCTNLTTAPELPATILADGCYINMFHNCKSLIIAPVLPAKELKYGCYNRMFYRCTNLNYIKCLAENNISDNTVLEILSSSINGTFVKSKNVDDDTWKPYVPSKWKIISE